MQSLYTDMTYSFLTKLVHMSTNADIESISEMGVSAEQADIITALPHSDLRKLSRIYQLIDIDVDVELLDKAISLARDGVRQHVDIPDMDVTHKLLSNIASLAADEHESSSLAYKFNLSQRKVQEIAKLNLLDTLAIARTGIVWYEIIANEIKLPMALEFIAESHREAHSINQLVIGDASFPMVQALTGMGKAAFQEMRKSLNAPKTLGGPPRRLSDDEQVLAWHVWNQTKDQYTIERCLSVSKTLNNIALRHLWPTLSGWIDKETQSRVKRTA